MMRRSALAALTLLALACDKPPDPVGPLDPKGEPGEAPPGGGAPVDPPPDDPDGKDENSSPDGGARVPMVAAEHPLHGRLEGADFGNTCDADAQCRRGGCSGEVCTAEEGVNTTCDVLEVQFPADAACGCVEKQCRWYSPSGARLSGSAPSTTVPATGDGTPPSEPVVQCDGKTCKPGQACVGYYGVAGTSGPKFHSCEWVCKGGCPPGTKCITIADGPGRVCR